VNQTPLQFTKRQMQAVLGSPRLWVALAAAAVVFGLAGPFGTYEALPLPARLGYWALVAVTTYLTGFLTVSILEALFHTDDKRPSTASFALYGAIGGIPVAVLVWLINLWVFGSPVISYGLLLAYTAPLAAVASGCVAYFSASLHKPAAIEAAATPVRPPLLDRLPPERRGEIYYLTMQDHYVEVVTSNGASLVLLRLADAIREVAPVEGFQIHRSHWVARNAVRQTLRHGDRMMLRMADGAALPVSRARLRALKDAGFA
jgi:hypothetical protein